MENTHENIVKVLRIGQLKNSFFYYVDMERCELSLRDYFQGKIPVGDRGAFTDEEAGLFYKGSRAWPSVRKAWYVIDQVAKGLHFVHGKDLVHRDLKPENSKPFYTHKTDKRSES